MANKRFPVGTENTTNGHTGGLGNKGYRVDTMQDTAKTTPNKAQTNKKNYATEPYQLNGCR